MAGSVGYEQDHYELSMQIGELVLFPAVRAAGRRDYCLTASTSAATSRSIPGPIVEVIVTFLM